MKRMSNKDADRALRALEQRVPEMDDAALDALNAQAYEKFMQRRKRRGRMHRRIAAVCAATLGILVVSFGFSVLMPNKVGQANNGVKKVALWFGEKLHLDLKFDQPVDDEAWAGIKEEKEFYSIEEALKELKMPIIGLKEESGFVLEKLKTRGHAEEQSSYYRSIYVNDEAYCVFSIEKLGDTTTAAIFDKKQIGMDTPIGTAVVWVTDEECLGVLITEEFFVQITSNASIEDILSLSQYFTMFTQP